jgi:uncharacterized protein involved in exopolysaccharide biosynthesis
MAIKRMFWSSGSEVTEEVGDVTPISTKPGRPRRRMTLILTLMLSGALGGFLISYLFPPKYVSQATVLVESQKVPEAYVQPIITTAFAERVQTISQRVVSPGRLRPMIDSLNLGLKPEDERKLISGIGQNMTIDPLMTVAAATASPVDAKTPSANDEPVRGFTVGYTDSDPVRSQKICNALASLMVDQNLLFRSEVTQSTTEFLHKMVEDAGHDMEAKGALLSASRNRMPNGSEAEAKGRVPALDYENAQARYKDLLAKKSSADLSANMENMLLGEQMNIVTIAGFPDSPEFPVRSQFALWGLGAGLLLGISRLLWPAARKLFQLLASLFPVAAETESPS